MTDATTDAKEVADDAELDAYGKLYEAIGELCRAHRALDAMADGLPHPQQILAAMREEEAHLATVVRLARDYQNKVAHADALTRFKFARRGVLH